MDVMAPELVWVDGGCYRFCDSEAWRPTDKASPKAPPKARPEKVAPRERSEESRASRSPEIEIMPIAGGRFKHSMYIAPRYYPFIVGPKASVLSLLQRNTNTSIFVPKENCPPDIVITGPSRSTIENAVRAIFEIIRKARSVVDPNFFLSIPMTDESIKSNFIEFRNNVIDECESSEKIVCHKIFENPERLHLSLGTLLLVDASEVRAACVALEEWKSAIAMPMLGEYGPIMIKVQGLDHMNHHLQTFGPIYGRVSSENDVLQKLAERTATFFLQKGLMIRERRDPKLRMELTRSFAPAKDKVDREALVRLNDVFAARKDYVFGETLLDELHLLARDRYDSDGCYAAAAKMRIFD